MTTTVICKPTSGTFIRPDNLGGNYFATAKSKMLVQNFAPGGYSYLSLNLPAQLADRAIVSAHLMLSMETVGGGTRTLTVQRHAKPDTAYSSMTGNNDPGVYAGSTAVSVTQSALDGTAVRKLWDFDVTADVAAIKAGAPFYGFRISTTYTSIWNMAGWQSISPPYLVVELADPGDPPEGLTPDGLIGIASPTMTWVAPSAITRARVQTDEAGGDYSSPVWTSAWVTTSIPQLDLSTVSGWTPLTAGGSIQVRVEHDVVGFGPTGYGDPVTLTRDTTRTLSITSPASTTHDPTPTVAWTTTGQTAYQVTVSSNGVVLQDTGIVPGSASAWTPNKGATVSGQVLSIRVRTFYGTDRVASPGDPGYLEATVTTTYTPGTATGVTSITATQNGVRPWVNLAWAIGTIPDEWLLERDSGSGYETLARFAGTSGGSPVLSYVDVTCPPNRSVTYRIRPITAGTAGASTHTATVRTKVTGAWVLDPDLSRWFRFGGQDLRMVQAESSVWYEPYGRQESVKFTFALRGWEGGIGGTMKDYDGRTVEQYQADFDSIKSETHLEVRLVWGDQNIPVIASMMSSTINAEQSTVDHTVKNVVLDDVRQSGEVPYPAVVP